LCPGSQQGWLEPTLPLHEVAEFGGEPDPPATVEGRPAMTRISVNVDGVAYSDEVENRTLLVQYLREQVGKTGTVIGCDTTNCGACTVLLDGRSI